MEAGFLIKQPGPRTLIQDAGRVGFHHLGMTTGGPVDPWAFRWANRLCGNHQNTTVLEVAVGGLIIESNTTTRLSVCGANMPLKINGRIRPMWRSHWVKPGDIVELGFAANGICAYLAVAGGFDITAVFGSTATVAREGIGGLNGTKLELGDFLPCADNAEGPCLLLPKGYRPVYSHHATLRVILGYQQHDFSRYQQRRFFSHEFKVSTRSDRMGCCLEGPKIRVNSNGVLSEGICLGAIQVPPDGQPIILMNDRQTIGGYPKLGSVFSMDLAQLAQLKPDSSVHFKPITVEEAHNLNHLAERYFEQINLVRC
jgi:biotin-dependent carboxylase-like uncharacterized protein